MVKPINAMFIKSEFENGNHQTDKFRLDFSVFLGEASADNITQFTNMADKEDINPENIKGTFYVDSQCIDCDLCRETAPNNFRREEDEGYSYVYKQPENDDEREQCVEAMDGCPVEAIGDDGGE